MTVHFLSLSSTKIQTLSEQRIMMSISVLLKAHVHPKCIANPLIQKNDFRYLKIAVFSMCRVTLWPSMKKSEHPMNVSVNQNTAFDKKVFQNNNTSVQSHLGEHEPLKDDLLCLSWKWTHSRKRIVKLSMLIGPRKVKIVQDFSFST